MKNAQDNQIKSRNGLKNAQGNQIHQDVPMPKWDNRPTVTINHAVSMEPKEFRFQGGKNLEMGYRKCILVSHSTAQLL